MALALAAPAAQIGAFENPKHPSDEGRNLFAGRGVRERCPSRAGALANIGGEAGAATLT